MKLEPMNLEDCQKLANDLNDYDLEHNPEQLSTLCYDPKMWRNAKCWGIMVDDVVAGFVVLKPMGVANGYCLWLSLHPSFRDGVIGAQATASILNHAFVTLNADMVISDVFEENKRSMKIHSHLFHRRDDKRQLNGMNVIQWGMSRERYFENLKRFKRYDI